MKFGCFAVKTSPDDECYVLTGTGKLTMCLKRAHVDEIVKAASDAADQLKPIELVRSSYDMRI
jgi:hypothetical protein